ncbi:MAG: glycosyltransferase family protein [Leptospirales bacterium]
MFVSGFTFCRNLVKLDYPFEESIRSLLPLVDEFVIAVGDSEDDTLSRIEKIGDSKIRIVQTVWDMNLRRDGLIYAQQTNIALENCHPGGDWAIYLQGDEVLHEKDYDGIRAAMERYRGDREILGLMMRYYHFVGDYSSIDPWAYRRSLRIVRPGGVVTSIGDAVGFARSSDDLYIGKKERSLWRYAPGHVYHYGWVKNSTLLREKFLNRVTWYWEGVPTDEDQKMLSLSEFMPENYDILKQFDGTHPSVMKERIASFPSMPFKRSRWLNPKFYRYVLRHGFKG